MEKSSNVTVNEPSALWNNAAVPVALPSTPWNVPLLTGAATLGEGLCSIIADADGDGLCSIMADSEGIALCSIIAEGLGVGGVAVAAAEHPASASIPASAMDPQRMATRVV